MDNKKIIIIVAVVAVIAVGAGFFFFSNQLQFDHTTLVLSKSAYMESPVAKNISGEPDSDGVFFYVDRDNDVNVTSCSNISKSNSTKTIDKIKKELQTKSKKTYEGDVAVYEKDGIYSIFVKNVEYNDTVLIQSADKDMLMACWATLKFHDPSESLKFNNTTNGVVINAAEQTEEVVQASTPSETTSTSAETSTAVEETTDYSSSSDWGYDWGGGDSGGGDSGSVGGSASVDDFDF